jgi:D-alanyl-lipoteichoic acid acyltransferase DltB (MBOAT superfamily)
MLFTTVGYWLFFAAVLALFYGLPFRVGKLLLLAASYYFYSCWDARFALLILGSTVLDYFLGLAIAGAEPRRKRLLVICSVVANLGILGFFKYYNFFVASLAALLGVSGGTWALRIVLPVGISFYTFKSMSYTIDVYKGWLRPIRSFLDYALFVVFFPELVAGPIVRADVFFPQLLEWKRPRPIECQRAIHLILFGLVKKLVFADRFAPIADAYFSDPGRHPGAVAAWTGALAFTMQIYFDFSGYTDIARGCAQLLGFKFPLNFNRPYLATSITEFWKRWHMSLSQWLRDYLYIPLGGNRQGRLMTYRNLMLTMLLGGLWHGASWNFVVWGGYHGLLLAGHRSFVSSIAGSRIERALNRGVLVPVKIACTLLLVVIGWVFFRAATLPDARMILRAMFAGEWLHSQSLLNPAALVLCSIAFVLGVLEEKARPLDRLALAPAWRRVGVYVVLFFSLELFSVTGQKIPFIYFQF